MYRLCKNSVCYHVFMSTCSLLGRGTCNTMPSDMTVATYYSCSGYCLTNVAVIMKTGSLSYAGGVIF